MPGNLTYQSQQPLSLCCSNDLQQNRFSEYFDLITMFRLRTISALVGLAALSMQVSEPS